MDFTNSVRSASFYREGIELLRVMSCQAPWPELLLRDQVALSSQRKMRTIAKGDTGLCSSARGNAGMAPLRGLDKD